MKPATMRRAVVCGLLFWAATSLVHAGTDTDTVTLANPTPAEQMRAINPYWTAERFRAAKPVMPLVGADARVGVGEPAPLPTAEPQGASGRAPSVQFGLPVQRLFAPPPQQLAAEAVQPHDTGTFNAPFTSSRVFPLFSGANAPLSADRAYPYRTVGKLFFSIDGQPFVCSGSVIQSRIVATAGHCVHSGTSRGFHSNFVFVPAFRDGTAPFAVWNNWRFAGTTGTWAGGGGTVPNAADYGMIVFGDQVVSAGGGRTKLGFVTGWLGWQTLSLLGNHTSKLGYPCNLDSCMRMQVVTSQSSRATSPNNVEYGSDARGGVSGGPFVQNFEQLSDGGGTGSNPGSNRVVGVTSYGYVSTDPKVVGASILDKRWVNLFNALCSIQAGNCN